MVNFPVEMWPLRSKTSKLRAAIVDYIALNRFIFDFEIEMSVGSERLIASTVAKYLRFDALWNCKESKCVAMVLWEMALKGKKTII